MAKSKHRERGEDLIDEIVQTYVRVYSEAKSRSARLAERFGVTMPQFTALHLIRNGAAPVYLSDISERLFVNQSTVSGLIDRMERDGLVVRERSSSDRRKIAIRLTRKGRKITETIPFSPMEILRELLRPLSIPERKTLLELLRKVSAPLMRTFEKIDRMEKEFRKTASGNA